MLARVSQMAVPITIPQATISMEEGTIVRWLKVEGEVVTEGDVLFEIETDKAVVEVPAPATGVLLRTLIAKGITRVNDVVGWIGEPGEALDMLDRVAPAETAQPQKAASRTAAPSQSVISSPAARRRAAEPGIEVASITGTGQAGRITEQDVERAANTRPAVGLRKSLAAQLSVAWREAPHINIGREIDASGLVAVRSKFPAVSFTSLFLYTVAKLLPAFPQLRQVWSGQELQQVNEINVCLAVETPKGVLTPVLRNLDKANLEELRLRQRQITESARAGQLKLEDMQGSFTLTNLGMYAADFFTPILNYPQTAILATGRVRQQPVIISDALGTGWRVWVNLAVDHRVTDGACAARFLEEFQQTINRLPKEVEVRVQS
jgi:pyruvate dehydrogenase E2 component (dihydrolipoamide acetyltransferase)